MRYLNEFFSLRSSGDILQISAPINKGPKEITEAMAIRAHLKKALLRKPLEYTVIDLCSGNALVPLITAFTLPSKKCYAVDKQKRNRNWHLAKRFQYIEQDIYDKNIYNLINNNSPCIITAVHCCKNLACRVIEIYKETEASDLIMMPCCVGKLEDRYPPIIREKLGKHLLWAMQLTEEVNGSLTIDQNVLSPRNCIIHTLKDK